MSNPDGKSRPVKIKVDKIDPESDDAVPSRSLPGEGSRLRTFDSLPHIRSSDRVPPMSQSLVVGAMGRRHFDLMENPGIEKVDGFLKGHSPSSSFGDGDLDSSPSDVESKTSGKLSSSESRSGSLRAKDRTPTMSYISDAQFQEYRDEEFSPIMEVVRGEMDFEFYLMEEEKFPAEDSVFVLPKDYIFLRSHPRARVDFETPGRLPGVSLKKVDRQKPTVREMLHCFTSDIVVVKRRGEEEKGKITAEFSFKCKRVVPTTKMLMNTKIKKIQGIKELKRENHILMLGSPKHSPGTIYAYTPKTTLLDHYKLLVEFSLLEFQSGVLGPLFCKVALYNLRTKVKLSEDYHFHLNSMDIINSLGVTDDPLKGLVKFVKENPRTMYDLDNPEPDPDISIVIVISAPFISDNRPYLFPNKHKNSSPFVETSKKKAFLWEHRQPIAYGAIPIYVVSKEAREAMEREELKKKKKKRMSLVITEKSLSVRDSKSMLAMEGYSGEEISKEISLIKSILERTLKPNESGDKKKQETPKDLLHHVLKEKSLSDSRIFDDIEVSEPSSDIEMYQIRSGVVEMKLYAIPTSSFQLLELLAQEKKSNKIEGRLVMDLTPSHPSQFIEKDESEPLPINDYIEYDMLMEKTFHHSLPLVKHAPHRFYTNFLYVYPHSFIFSGILGLGVKKQNVGIRFIIRNEDSIRSLSKLSCLKVFMRKNIIDKKKSYCYDYYSEIINLGDKKKTNKFYTDEVKILLPFEISEKIHLVAIVYHVPDEEEKKPNNQEILGYSFVLLTDVYSYEVDKEVLDERIITLPLYKELEAGYLSKEVKKSMKKKTVKRRKVSLRMKFVSSINPVQNPSVNSFLGFTGRVMDVLENTKIRADGRMEKLNDVIEHLLEYFYDLIEELDLAAEHINAVMTQSLSFMVRAYEKRNLHKAISDNMHRVLLASFSLIQDFVSSSSFNTHAKEFAHYYFSHFCRCEKSFTVCLCEVWLMVLLLNQKSNLRKKKRVSRYDTKRKKRIRGDMNDLAPVSVEHSAFWFHILTKSILHERKIADNEKFQSSIEKLIVHIINIIFHRPSTEMHAVLHGGRTQEKNSPVAMEFNYPDYRDAHVSTMNIRLAQFICDLFGVFPDNIFPKKLIHYYQFSSVFTPKSVVKQSEIRKRNLRCVKLKSSFLTVLSANKYFIEFNHPFPYPIIESGKQHLLMDIFLDSIALVITNPLRLYDALLIRRHLAIIHTQLLELDFSPDRQSIDQRETLAGMYFPFFEKLLHMSYLYDVDFPKEKKEQKNFCIESNINLLSHLIKPERETLSTVLLWILVNVQKDNLCEWLDQSDFSTPIYFVKFLKYMLVSFIQKGDVVNINPVYDFYIMKVLDLFRFFLIHEMDHFMSDLEFTEVIREVFDFTFLLHVHSIGIKFPKLVYMYYLENTVRFFCEWMGPKLCLQKNDLCWKRCLLHLMQISEFPLQLNTNTIIQDCYDLILGTFLRKIQQRIREKPLEEYVVEEEIVGKNILLNEGGNIKTKKVFLKGTVKGASLSKLVEYIVFKRNDRVVDEKVFFITHRSFTSSLDLMNVFVSLYKHYYNLFQETKEKHYKPMFSNVVKKIELWISVYYNTLDNMALTFLIKCLNDKVFTEDALTTIKNALVQSLYENGYPDFFRKGTEKSDQKTKKKKSIVPNRFKNKEKTMKKISEFDSWQEYNRFILQWDMREVARQMCLLEFEIYCKITPGDFFKKRKDKTITNIDLLTQRFNGVSAWVQNSFIVHANKKKRRDVAKKFIELLKQLRRLRNFNAVNEIVSAFYSGPIERIFSPEMIPSKWPKINGKEFQFVQSCGELMSTNQSYKALRERLENAEFAIPFMGIYQSDIVKIECGNPDHWKVNYEGVENKLINLNKRKLIAETLKSVEKFQRNEYSRRFRKVPMLYEVLREIANRADFMRNQEIFKKSLEYKQRR